MTSQWEPVLKDVISDALETMFFCMVDFDEEVREGETFDYKSEIGIINHSGRLAISLYVSAAFARTITANLLGLDEDQIGEDDIEDSLKELTNMVGGGYHARIKNSEWMLGIPQVWKTTPNQGSELVGSVGLHFSCFGELMGAVQLEHVPDTQEVA